MTFGFTRRRIVVVASLCIAGLVAACSTPSTPPASGTNGGTTGGLVASRATVDLGRVPFDVQAEGRFELVNTSSRPVKLTAAPQVKMLEGC